MSRSGKPQSQPGRPFSHLRQQCAHSQALPVFQSDQLANKIGTES